MSKVKAFQLGVDEAILAIEGVCDEFWRDYGLPELLSHLEAVVEDLINGRLKAALEQHGMLDEKLLRFSMAIANFHFQDRATGIWAKFRGAVHAYPIGNLQAVRKGYLRDVKDAILELREIHACAWEAYGLPELLEHLQSVAVDLRESKVRRALGQIPFLNEKFERFGWAVRGFPIGRRVAMIAATFGGVVMDHVPDETPYSEYVRPNCASRTERLTRRITRP